MLFLLAIPKPLLSLKEFLYTSLILYIGQEAVIEMVKEKQRKWKAKLERMRDDGLVKIVYEEEAKGKRRRGRPRKRWRENISIIDE